ncbi:MAG: hypothetical protein SVP26_10800 [Chloroflexota bacterium]|nr:hypothetical protein [Chloroflexota bacterium]
MVQVRLETVPVFTRRQVHCKYCGVVFYVDTERNSAGEEILTLEDIRCGYHPSEGSVIELV